MEYEPKIKWVKRANQWCLTTYELDKKTNKMVNRQTWSREYPALPEKSEV